MGVDTIKFHPDKKSAILNNDICKSGKKLLFVGSIIETKGIRDLIEAIPYVVANFPDTQLLVVGEGNLKNEMIQLTKKLKIENNVTFKGSLPNNELPRYYASVDIFTLPSLSEGYPLVVMEALSSGTICVVSDIAIFKEIHKKTGLLHLVPVRNKNALAQTIIHILEKKDDMLELQRKCRAYAEKELDWDTIISSFVKCYKKTYNK
jgi:glycosyltransferase involved in cell wall biosynthesis